MKRVVFIILASLSFLHSQSILNEGFESGIFPPTSWSLQTIGNGFVTYEYGYSGMYSAAHLDNAGTQDDWLITPQLYIPNDEYFLGLWQYGNWLSYYTYHEICVSTNLIDWTNIYSGHPPLGGGEGGVWEKLSLPLGTFSGQNIYIGFHYMGDFSDVWLIDDVSVYLAQILPPVATEATNISYTYFTANWNASDKADGYRIDIDDNSDFSSPLVGYTNLDLGNVLFKLATGLTAGTVYYYRVRAYNDEVSGNSNVITVHTPTYFTDTNTALIGALANSSVAWGDYDNDGDLDILLTGSTGNSVAKVYQNDDGLFTDINAAITGVYNSSVAWGDYDNDGDLDVLLTGYTGSLYKSKIYRNDDGLFIDINSTITGVAGSSVAWGDYDNDGDLDILLTGHTGSSRISKIYRNDDGFFTDINAAITGVSNSSVAWGDYDNDGDLDILLTGYTGSVRISKVYRNDDGLFTDINATITGVNYSSVAWGDYDNDGDLDILLTGYTGSVRISKVYRNDDGLFTDINATITGVETSSVAWGDYDNDGDLDVLLTGYTGSTYISKIYRNDSGIFTDINAAITGVTWGSVAWGDYDKDGDLDILITGYTGSTGISKIYQNNSIVENTNPSTPTNLSTLITDMSVNFNWSKSADNETPQDGLSYNLYFRSDSLYVKSPMSNDSTGYRKVVSLGNTGQKNSWTINDLPGGKYYWSVQAVDHAFAGSEFAPERSFFIGTLSVPSNVAISELSGNVTVTWNAIQYADSYKVFASSDPYGTYSDVSSQGTFNGTQWTQAISGNKLFYYVVAVAGSK